MSVSTIVAITAALLFGVWTSCLHRIDEGYVGVYYRGALLDGISSPGYHLKSPITTVYGIETKMQKDEVLHVPCGVKGGARLTIERIEVVNELPAEHVHATVKKHGPGYDRPLIFDRVVHEVNQFCSGKTLQQVYIDEFDQFDDAIAVALRFGLEKYGIILHNVRITKPVIPLEVQAGYDAKEAARTRLLAVEEERKVARARAEAEREQALIEANKTAAVQASEDAKILAMKRAEQERERIDDAIRVAKRRADADAEAYAIETKANATRYEIEQRALANKELLTPEYLMRHRNEALLDNTKIYFGPNVPSLYSAVGVYDPE